MTADPQLGAGAFRYARGFTARDNENHDVDSPNPDWQESSYFFFADARARLGGLYRIAIHPNRGTANLYLWTQVGGRMVSRRKLTDQPMPPGPTTGTELGGVSIETLDPCRQFRIRIDRDGVLADVVWTSLTGPVDFSLNGSGDQVVAAGHYNSLGTARGTIRYAGVPHELDGVGYMDHSWGVRDMSTVYGHCSLQPIFSPDDFVHTITAWGPAGEAIMGYNCADGVLSPLSSIQATYTIAQDCRSPKAVEMAIRDALGRSRHLSGRVVGETSLQPYGQGYFATHGIAEIESGGQRATGFLEWAPPPAIPPVELELLGLAPNDAWLNRPFSSSGSAI
jgi:hypothetical protein